ncbi:NAD+ synthase [Candidatus Riflebacteria bacterium]
MRIILAQINPIIGDIKHNSKKILEVIKKARADNVQLIILPELCLCGYPPEDLLLYPGFILELEKYLSMIVAQSNGLAIILGTARQNSITGEKGLFNSAAVIFDGQLIGFQDKFLLPTYDVFDERRYFEHGTENRVWELFGLSWVISICEDIWQDKPLFTGCRYDRQPIYEHKGKKVDFLVNLSASPFCQGHGNKRIEVCRIAATNLSCPVFLCNQVGGNDGLIFDGHSLYMDCQGQILKKGKGFAEDCIFIDTEKNYEYRDEEPQIVEELYNALILGIRDYFVKQGFKKACLGLSGGIDSALVACLAREALGKENVMGISMPSRYSSDGSKTDAEILARNLAISFTTVPIEEPFTAYLNLLEPHFTGRAADLTEENLQARIRGMILMAFSNKFGYIVLNTGNKSEIALGYCTLYGDMCGGLGVLSDVSKMQVYALARWINRKKEIIPENTILKPPSAELRPDQKDSDNLPPYEIIDTILKDYLEEHKNPEQIAKKNAFAPELVSDIIKKIHKNEFKRRQAPLGLRVSKKAFNIGRRFPIVHKWHPGKS